MKCVIFVDKGRAKSVIIKFMNFGRKKENEIVIRGKGCEVNSCVRDDSRYKFLLSEVFAGFGDC